MILSWNVRGFNDPLHIKEVSHLVNMYNVPIVGLYKTKLRKSLEVVNHAMFHQQWSYVTTYGSNGIGRMKVCWDTRRCNLTIVSQGNQWIHVWVEIFEEPKQFFLTFVYGSIDSAERMDLWNFLLATGSMTQPWGILGDFNAVRSQEERVGGREKWRESDNVLNRVLYSLGMDDLRGVGCSFTWSNRRSPPIVAKLDRVVINKEWIEAFRLSEAHFLAPTTSDHSPCLLRLSPSKRKAGAFKFFDFWRSHPGYGEALARGWSMEYTSLHMFRLCCRLKDLKCELKSLNRNHLSDISNRVDRARIELEALQMESLLGKPNIEEEKSAMAKFNKLARMEESFYKQKARATWLKLGDRNTSYFHSEVNRRANWNAITLLELPNGERITEQESIREEVVKHFQTILTRKDGGCQEVSVVGKLLKCSIASDHHAVLTQEVTSREIKETIFSMPSEKARARMVLLLSFINLHGAHLGLM
ncbi:hypothetical protein MLD38_029895 [Melastoma candidum]|uniref:Uncharacterized protein n=1 Tax=Melastoma candidum TaxID=119954 RepID=A0ACB9MJX6_9MYRT|nr:hypothetical protein MLD38_029895 [Melastoma candidum]